MLPDTSTEQQRQTKALPKLAKKAGNEDLRAAFENHLDETQKQIKRLEEVFGLMDMPIRGKKCKGMESLIKEGNEMISEAEEPALDALLIAAAQKCEHYEIAAYGTMRVWAKRLGKGDVASILEDSLEEEKEADRKLTEIAEHLVNEAAAQGDSEDQEEVEKKSSVRNRRQAAADRARPSKTEGRKK